MPELLTARLRLRPVCPNDLDALAVMWADPDVTRYLPGGEPFPRQVALEELSYMMEHWQQHGFGSWAITLKETTPNGFIGYCLLQYLHAGRCGVSEEIAHSVKEVELGYALAKPFWGQGYASEAARAVVQFAFEEANLPRLVAAIHPDNAASRHILEGLGMILQPEMNYYGECPHFSLTRQQFDRLAVT